MLSKILDIIISILSLFKPKKTTPLITTKETDDIKALIEEYRKTKDPKLLEKIRQYVSD